MNNVTRCSSREVDSTNDNDTLQSQRELLKSFIPQLDSAMGWYDAICKVLKERGEGIEGRIARFDGSDCEKAGISRDIAALLEEWETLEKNSQMVNETLGEYTKELQRLDKGIQIPAKLSSVEFPVTFSQFLLNLDCESICDPPGGDALLAQGIYLTDSLH